MLRILFFVVAFVLLMPAVPATPFAGGNAIDARAVCQLTTSQASASATGTNATSTADATAYQQLHGENGGQTGDGYSSSYADAEGLAFTRASADASYETPNHDIRIAHQDCASIVATSQERIPLIGCSNVLESPFAQVGQVMRTPAGAYYLDGVRRSAEGSIAILEMLGAQMGSSEGISAVGLPLEPTSLHVAIDHSIRTEGNVVQSSCSLTIY